MIRRMLSLLVALVLLAYSASAALAWPDEQLNRENWNPDVTDLISDKTDGPGNTHLFIIKEALRLLKSSSNEKYRQAAAAIEPHLDDIQTGNFRADNDPGNDKYMARGTDINEVSFHYNEDTIFRNHFFDPARAAAGQWAGGTDSLYANGTAVELFTLWYSQSLRAHAASANLDGNSCRPGTADSLYPWALAGVEGHPFDPSLGGPAPTGAPQWMGTRFEWDLCSDRSALIRKGEAMGTYQWTAQAYEQHAWELLGASLHFLADLGHPYHTNHFGATSNPSGLHSYAERVANFYQTCYSFADDIATSCPAGFRVQPKEAERSPIYDRTWAADRIALNMATESHALYSNLKNDQIDAAWRLLEDAKTRSQANQPELNAMLSKASGEAMQKTIRFTAGYLVKWYFDGEGAAYGPASDQEIRNLRITSISANNAAVEWDSTQPSDSWAVVRTGTSDTPVKTSGSGEVTLHHRVVVEGLATAQPYDFEVRSADGYQAASVHQSFTLSGQSATDPGSGMIPSPGKGSTAPVGNATALVNNYQGSNTVRLRAGPGLDAAILGEMTNGTQITVVAGPVSRDSIDWYQVVWNDHAVYRIGWSAGWALKFLSGPALVDNYQGSELRLRADHSMNATIITTMPNGEWVSVLSGPEPQDGIDWYQVKWKVAGTELTGWSAGWALRFILANPSPNPGTAVVNNTQGKTLRLRTGPGVASTILTEMPNAAELSVTAGPVHRDSVDWYQVSWATPTGTMTGWSAGWALQFQLGRGLVNNYQGTDLRLRSGPGVDSTILTNMPNGTWLFIRSAPVAKDGVDWHEVAWTDRGETKIGWSAGWAILPVFAPLTP